MSQTLDISLSKNKFTNVSSMSSPNCHLAEVLFNRFPSFPRVLSSDSPATPQNCQYEHSLTLFFVILVPVPNIPKCLFLLNYAAASNILKSVNTNSSVSNSLKFPKVITFHCPVSNKNELIHIPLFSGETKP